MNAVSIQGLLLIAFGLLVQKGLLPVRLRMLPRWFMPVALLATVLLSLRRGPSTRSVLLITAMALVAFTANVPRSVAVLVCEAGGAFLIAIGLMQRHPPLQYAWAYWVAGVIVISLILFAV